MFQLIAWFNDNWGQVVPLLIIAVIVLEFVMGQVQRGR